jgi:two-component SAPR family response regulator
MNIIAVDDERLSLMGLKSAIEEALHSRNDQHCTVSLNCFRESIDALEYAQTHNIDIAFLDIEMGGMNGIELAKALKNKNSKIDIIFVTGYSKYQTAAAAIHPCGFIVKPVTAETVADFLFAKDRSNPAFTYILC